VGPGKRGTKQGKGKSPRGKKGKKGKVNKATHPGVVARGEKRGKPGKFGFRFKRPGAKREGKTNESVAGSPRVSKKVRCRPSVPGSKRPGSVAKEVKKKGTRCVKSVKGCV